MGNSTTHHDRGQLDLQGAYAEAYRCVLCHDAPCSKACPAGTDPGRFMRQLRFANPDGAARTVLDNNPFGGVCGLVCPVSRLCEQACSRQALDRPIQIGAVQNFLHRFGLEQKVELPPVPKHNGKRVAVVGAGPAGLTAARELARRGAHVTVFESRPKAGGILRYGIAPFRLGDDVIDHEVERIERMGVEIRTSSPVRGRDGLQKLRAEGFDSVVVSTGLQAGNRVDVSGSELPQVVTALDFLASANVDGPLGDAYRLVHGKDVAVIGGGSVAMDVANTSRELGAKRTYVLSLEALDELPADREEVALANAHQVIFKPQTRLCRIVGQGGAVVGVETIETDWKEAGSLVPNNAVDRPGTDGKLRVQAVVFAIRQTHDDVARELVEPLGRAAGGVVVVDADTGASSESKIYAGGDVTNGGATVVGAVADGKRIAAAIMPGVDVAPRPQTPSLETEFCGVKFPNPFCLSSSPVTNSAEMCGRAFEAGWGGIYYKTLGVQSKYKIYHPSPRLNAVHHEGVRTVGLQNVEQITDRPLADNVRDIGELRKRFPKQVVAVSIMGFCDEDWPVLAHLAEDAGAQLLELNFSCPHMSMEGAGAKIAHQFDTVERATAAAKGACKIPVIAKMTPNITDMLPCALASQRGGADGISAINTVRAISNVDLETQIPMPTIQGRSSISGYSGSVVRPVALRFIAELSKAPELRIPVSGVGGVTTWRDAAEFLLLGARNVQVTTGIMRYGHRIVEDLTDGLRTYLRKVGAKSVDEIVGRALSRVIDPAELDHRTEAVSQIDRDKCIGCGQCYVSCQDGANQAIRFEPTDRKATVDEERCVGCLLCRHVCPVDGCVSYKVRTRAEFANAR